jgi:hypothetical protein
MRTGPSSVRTVFAITPLRWLVVSSGFTAPGAQPRWGDNSAPSALDQRLLEGRREVLNRLGGHRTDHELSMSSFGIFGIRVTAVLAACVVVIK